VAAKLNFFKLNPAEDLLGAPRNYCGGELSDAFSFSITTRIDWYFYLRSIVNETHYGSANMIRRFPLNFRSEAC